VPHASIATHKSKVFAVLFMLQSYKKLHKKTAAANPQGSPLRGFLH
jgi:hypothetical protein